MPVGISNREAGGPKTAGPGAVFTVVVAAIFMSNLDLFIVNVALPSIGRDFGGSSLAGLSWVLNAYAIVFAALLVPAGRLGDRTGQRRVFLAGIAIFTLASAACAAAPDLAVLVAARVVQASGAAALIPTSLALLLAATPRGQAGRPGPGLGRGRRRLGRAGPGGGRAAGPAGLAVGVPGQPADRGGRAAGREPGAAAPAGPGQRAASRTCSAWCCSPPGSAG